MSRGGDIGYDLRVTVEDLWVSGHAAWPDLVVDRAALAAHLSAVETEPGAELRADDLYLACACATGSSQAIEALETTHADALRGVIARLARDPAQAEELRQVVRQHLFVTPAGGRPKIADYAGRGRLENWLRVAALRVCLNAIRGKNPARPADDSGALDVLPDRGDDVELAFLKAQYRAAFRAAFAAAVGELAADERAVLRMGLIHQLSIDQLGKILGVHRATAARRLAAARERLVALTLARLKTSLALDDAELRSLQREVDTHVDVSLSRLLAHP